MGIIHTIVEAMEFLDKLIEATESYNTARHLKYNSYIVYQYKGSGKDE